MDEMNFTEMFPLAEDTTEYRRLSSDHVGIDKFRGHDMLVIEPEAFTLLTEQAFRDRLAAGGFGHVGLRESALAVMDALTWPVERIDENIQPLEFGPENVLGEHGVRFVEYFAEEAMHEVFGDPVAQPAGQHFLALVVEVFQDRLACCCRHVRCQAFECLNAGALIETIQVLRRM